MASFPSAKVHRPGKTRLSRGQSVLHQPVTIEASAASAVVTLTFSSPVVVRGNIPLTLSGSQTLVSQTVVNQLEVQQTYSAALGTSTWSIPANTPQISTFLGGGNAAASGTF